MKIFEYGDREKKKIILIHGFQSPYTIWEKYIDHLKDEYNVLVPVLPGHNPNEKEEFTSFDYVVSELEEYITSHFGKEIYAIYGMSMGGIVAAKLVENGQLSVDKVIIESTPLLSYGKFLTHIMTKQYLSLTKKSRKREQKVLSMAVDTIISKDKLDDFLAVLDNMTDATIKNYIREIGKYNLEKERFTKNTELYYLHGTTINEMLAKKTAKYIKNNHMRSNVVCFKGKNHCQDSLLCPETTLKVLDYILNDKK